MKWWELEFRVAMDGEFVEGEHPRDEGGKFTSGAHAASHFSEHYRMELANQDRLPERKVLEHAEAIRGVMDDLHKNFNLDRNTINEFLRLKLQKGNTTGHFRQGGHESASIAVPTGVGSRQGDLTPGKHNVEAPSSQYVMRHELSHALERHIDTEMKRVNMTGVNVDALFRKEDKGQIVKNISKYAATDPREWFAESLAAYLHPGFGSGRVKINPKLQQAFETVLGKRRG